MSKPQTEPDRAGDRTPPEAAGDNRRAGDTDGNAAGGNSKSKGATNPADQPPSPAAENADES
jgi:hypothetical protein